MHYCTHPVFLSFQCRAQGVSRFTLLSWLFNFLKFIRIGENFSFSYCFFEKNVV